MRSKRIVIFNVFGHQNTGDAMLVEALVDLLRSNGGEYVEGIAFDVASEDRWMPEVHWHERVATARRSSLSGRFQQLWSLAIAVALATSRLLFPLRHLLPAKQRSAVEALFDADLAISCPGGYFEDSRFAYLIATLQVFLARRLAKTVVMAPQSIGPIRSSLGRRILRAALLRVDLIFVREEHSHAFVEGLLAGEGPPLKVAGDLAFWYARRRETAAKEEWKKLKVDADQPLLGLTVVDWNFPHNADPRAAKRRYLEALSGLIEFVRCEGRHRIVIFNQVSSDLGVSEELGRLYPDIVVDRYERDSGAFASMVSKCDIFIGSRFHSCIFGLLGSVPTGAIAYLPKTTGIMRAMGLEEHVLQIDTLTAGELIELYMKLVSRAGEVSEATGQAVDRYRSSNQDFVNFVQSWLADGAQARVPGALGAANILVRSSA